MRRKPDLILNTEYRILLVMRFLTQAFLTLFIVSSLLFLVSNSVYADSQFETDYKVHYTVNKNGTTHVAADITLKNKTPNYFADKFQMKIGSTKVSNVTAKDDSGTLETNVNFENNITTIDVKFRNRVIGQGKSLAWTLNYQTDEIAAKSGTIWEISIPKLAKSDDTGLYDATVTVPKDFGQQAFAAPNPVSTNVGLLSEDYLFNKDQLLESGIAMSFGDKQIFSFNLKYFMNNTNLTSQVMNITLPPDNNYQKIVLDKIDPKPIDVAVDGDGNFLAKYKLGPKQKITVNVQGEVEVFSKPFRKIVSSLSESQKNIFTQPQRYWEIDNAVIRDKAQELKTPQKIYDFVATYLTYNNDRLNLPKVERKGAIASYNSPQDAICTEFTDLFIALARAAKIPAREVEGFAYTQNERLRPLSLSLYDGDVLHAWPEYWDDDKGWIQIDPTWDSTSGGLDYFNKLDFNHITFVQRGTSSTQPYPAGAYKDQNNQNEKTVFVQFAQNMPSPTSQAQIIIDAPQKAYGSFPFKVKATLKNTGTTSIIGQTLNIFTQNLEEPKQGASDIEILPPYSQKSYTFNFVTSGLAKNLDTGITFTYANVQSSKTIQILPFYKIVADPMFLLSVGCAAFVVVLGLILYKKIDVRPRFTKKHS